MGKAKKRSLALGINNKLSNLTREEAITQIVRNIEQKQEAIELITLFGVSAEELLEAGASYEDVVSFGRIIILYNFLNLGY